MLSLKSFLNDPLLMNSDYLLLLDMGLLIIFVYHFKMYVGIVESATAGLAALYFEDVFPVLLVKLLVFL